MDYINFFFEQVICPFSPLLISFLPTPFSYACSQKNVLVITGFCFPFQVHCWPIIRPPTQTNPHDWVSKKVSLFFHALSIFFSTGLAQFHAVKMGVQSLRSEHQLLFYSAFSSIRGEKPKLIPLVPLVAKIRQSFKIPRNNIIELWLDVVTPWKKMFWV